MVLESTQIVSKLWDRFEGISEDQRRSVSVDVIRKLQTQRQTIDEWTIHWVAEARAQGATWSAIGGALGITHQAASQRFGPALRSVEAHPSDSKASSNEIGPLRAEGADVPRR